MLTLKVQDMMKDPSAKAKMDKMANMMRSVTCGALE